MKPFLRKARLIVLLAGTILILTGCRVRTSETAPNCTDPQIGAVEAQVGMG